MKITQQQKNQHLLWRFGFGPLFKEFATSISPQQVWQQLKADSQNPPVLFDKAGSLAKEFIDAYKTYGPKAIKNMSPEQKKELRRISRDGIKELNLNWLSEMVKSPMQLREKMAFFWHGHFANRTINILYQEQHINIMRSNALGSFRDLLFASAKSAALLDFLNNNQNKVDHPNENFARELLELFTMGRGHYTEQDVKEAARAFTGWTHDEVGNFLQRPGIHDKGTKTFLGKSGNFDGADILNTILEQPQTARYITTKIYKFIVSDQVDEKRVDKLSKRFFQSDYSIIALLDEIAGSDWFYDEAIIGTKIKSPVELLAGIQRQMPVTIFDNDGLIQIQRALGQVLCLPPNVAGWPGGQDWIDSSTLMIRLGLAGWVLNAAEITAEGKDDDDTDMGMRKRRAANNKMKKIQANCDWNAWESKFKLLSKESLCGYLLQTPEVNVNRFDFSSLSKATFQLIKSPEYQLC